MSQGYLIPYLDVFTFRQDKTDRKLDEAASVLLASEPYLAEQYYEEDQQSNVARQTATMSEPTMPKTTRGHIKN